MSKEMLVIKRGYDFSKWLLNHTNKFPKSYRFSVAAKLENAILDFIELTTVANMRRDKLTSQVMRCIRLPIGARACPLAT